MPEVRLTGAATLKPGEKKVVKAGETEILLIQLADTLVAVQPKCPHAGAPLEQGAICNNRLVCPWHMGTFALPTGDLLEPPPLKGLDTYAVRVESQDIFINTDSKTHDLPKEKEASNSRTFLLIGAGAASTAAAITLRDEGFAGHIVVVDPVADEPLDRTQLSKQALAGKMPLDQTRLEPLELLGAERITASVTRLKHRSRHRPISATTLRSASIALSSPPVASQNAWTSPARSSPSPSATPRTSKPSSSEPPRESTLSSSEPASSALRLPPHSRRGA